MAKKKRRKKVPLMPFEVNGMVFHRMVDLIEWTGLSKTTLSQRIKAKLDPQEVIRDNTKTYKFDRKSFTTLKALSEYSGVPYSALVARINKKGWTVRRAVTTPVKKQSKPIRRKFRIDGFTIHGFAELSRYTGISAAVLHKRIVEKKMSIRKAIEAPVVKYSSSGPIEAFGVTYQSINEAARAFGKCSESLRHRYKSMGNLEDALTKPNQCVVPVKVYGQQYESRAELARAYGIEYSLLNSRLQSGYTVKEAIDELTQ